MLTSCELYPVWLESSCLCVIYSTGFRAVSLATFSTSVCMNRADMTRYCNAWRKEGIWWWSLVCCPQDSPVDSKQEHLIKNQCMTACHLLFPPRLANEEATPAARTRDFFVFTNTKNKKSVAWHPVTLLQQASWCFQGLLFMFSLF